MGLNGKKKEKTLMIHWIKSKIRRLKIKWMVWFFEMEPDEHQRGLFEYC